MTSSLPAPRAYIACLASYNAGTLYGEWIDLAGKDADEIREEIEAILAKSPQPGAEEWAIHDYEGLPKGTSENPDLDELAEIVAALDEHGEPMLAWIEYGNDPDGFEDAYRGEWSSVEDYAENLIDDCYSDQLKNLPDILKYHIDYAGIGRDMEYGGDIFTIDAPGGVYVFDNH